MLHRLTFENFYSFQDSAEIDFVVDEKAPDTNAYARGSYGDRLTKVIAVVGPNASGKTNLLKSLVFLTWFMCSSIHDKGQEEIPFKPYLFCSAKRPSKFDLLFEIKEGVYRYELEITQDRVILERLSRKDSATKKFSQLFKRTWDSEKKAYIFSLKNYGVASDFQKLITPNSSIISLGYHTGHEESVAIVNYVKYLGTDVNEAGKNNSQQWERMWSFYKEHPNALKQAVALLSKFDTGIEKLDIKKEKGDNERDRFIVKSFHKSQDSKEEVSIAFKYESSGSRNLLKTLWPILQVREAGGIAVLDEMDAELHPLMLPELVKLFTSRTSNPKNAQLLFSTHSVQILNQLDKQQIMLVEKNKENASTAWCLKDMKVRADENFYSKYIAGAYGAVPDL